MIFRLMTGGIRENLALTPVLAECHHRFSDYPIHVETRFPELFERNHHVQSAGAFIEGDGEEFVDLDEVSEINSDCHIIDIYARAVLGDERLVSRRMNFNTETGEDTPAHALKILGKIITTGFDLYDDMNLELIAPLKELGYWPHCLTGGSDSLEYKARQIAESDLYIGSDCDLSYLAMTTDTPMIMSFTNRAPRYSVPFRRNIPFEAIVTKPEVCDQAEFCIQKNGWREKGLCYGINCPLDTIVKEVGCPDKFVCEESTTVEDYLAAIERILLTA